MLCNSTDAGTSESIQALGPREHETAGISGLHAPDRTDMVFTSYQTITPGYAC